MRAVRKLASLSFVILAACSSAATPARSAGGGEGGRVAPPAVEERTVASGEVSLYVRVVGDDRRGTLVALHGGPGLSHEYLRPLEALAADGYRVGQYAMYRRRLQLEVEGVLSEEEPPAPQGDDCSAPVLAMMPAYFHDPRHPAATNLGGASCRQSTFEATILRNTPYDLRPGVAG